MERRERTARYERGGMSATRDCNLLEPIGSPRVVFVCMCAFVRFVVSCVLVLRVVLICVLVAFCSGLVRSHRTLRAGNA